MVYYETAITFNCRRKTSGRDLGKKFNFVLENSHGAEDEPHQYTLAQLSIVCYYQA